MHSHEFTLTPKKIMLSNVAATGSKVSIMPAMSAGDNFGSRLEKPKRRNRSEKHNKRISQNRVNGPVQRFVPKVTEQRHSNAGKQSAQLVANPEPTRAINF